MQFLSELIYADALQAKVHSHEIVTLCAAYKEAVLVLYSSEQSEEHLFSVIEFLKE